MNATDYNKKMFQEIEEGAKGKKLLMHACCAPCSTACLERIKDFFDISVLFYNPNIAGEEYIKRLDELKRFLSQTGWAKLEPCGHDEKQFYSAVRGLEREKEGGARCMECFRLRLSQTALVAAERGYDYITTTLTVSPLKNARAINEIGEKCAEENGVKWLWSDFKKGDGYLRSCTLSKEYSLYRQNFCGCVFSKGLEKDGGA